MLAYTGIETVSNMSEEAKDEATTIPKAIARVRLAVFAIYFTLPAVALSALPVYQDANGEYVTKLGLPEDEGGSAGDPVLGVVRAMDLGPLQTPIEFYVGLLAATILFLATNAGLIGISRLVYSMGIHRQLPDALRRLHPKYRTPWIGIIVFSGFAILVTLPGQAVFLGSVYSFGALLSFTMAHLAVVRLRMTKPDFPRPYKGPGNVTWRGVEWPLFAVAGGFFTAVAFVVIVVLNPTVAAFGVGWLTIGMVVYLVFRRRQGLDLTSTHKVAIPQPVVDHEAEYDSVLVPMGAEHYDESVGRDRGQARRAAPPRHPYPRDGDRPERAADRRADAGGGGRGAVDHRAGPRAGRRARLRARRARALRPGRAADHRGGHRHARGGDRDAAPLARQRGLAVRQDARDRARRAALPGDHRVRARAPEREAQGAGTGGGGVIRTQLLPILMVVIGVALIVRTLVEGVDGAAFGLVLGVLFIATGAGRLWLRNRR